MTLKFIEHIHLDIPKDLTPKIDEIGNIVSSAANKIMIQQAKKIDDEICKQIKDMAVANGIDDVYVLDKRNILSALEKQIPKKPTPHTVEPVEAPIKIGNANWCKGTTIYYCPNCKDFISRVYTYCHKCGQALDWSDTE